MSFNHPNFQARRARAEKKLEPVTFRPVRRNPLKKQTRVRMLRTVGGKFENGDRFNLDPFKTYYLDCDKADEYIIKGYAEGELSRNYSEDEKAVLRSTMQVVALSTIVEDTGAVHG